MGYWLSVWPTWLDIGQALFLRVDVEIHKLEKEEQTQYPAIVNKGFVMWLSGNFFLRDMAGSPERAV